MTKTTTISSQTNYTIQLLNPKLASELLEQWDINFIQVLTNDKPIVLADKNSHISDQVKGLQIEIKISSSAYKIDLATYSNDVILELRDLEWGVLLLINNVEYLLFCRFLDDLSPLEGLTKLSTLKLEGCVELTDLSPLSGLAHLSNLDLWECI